MINLTLKKQRAIVCGSTQGIGKAIANELSDLGAELVLIARDEKKLEDALRELNRSEGQKHASVAADFARPDELKLKLKQYFEQHPPVSILVNNTGGPVPGTAHEASSEHFQAAFTSHLVCNQILVQSVLPGMKQLGHGRIVNIVSTSVREPIAGLGVSNTIRAAVAGWAKTLSKELGAFKITVNNVLPGATKTQRMISILDHRSKAHGKNAKEIENEMIDEIPAGRFADPEEIAYLVCFLVSSQAAYISGQSIAVDGGRLACI